MPVLIDIGVTLNHYHSDMTRVVFFGEPDPKMKEIYEIVKGAQEAALKICKPGTRAGDLDMEARIWITDRGYGENFNHGLGHGIGLEVHELPVIRSASQYGALVLQPGMAITVEPGIYLPKLGGVRIEDTVIITEEGPPQPHQPPQRTQSAHTLTLNLRRPMSLNLRVFKASHNSLFFHSTL